MWDVKLKWWIDTFSQHQINFMSFNWSTATRKAWLIFNISWYTLCFSRLSNCNPPLWLYTITPEAWFIKSLRLILTPISIRLLHDRISVYMWFIVALKKIKDKYHNVFLMVFPDQALQKAIQSTKGYFEKQKALVRIIELSMPGTFPRVYK